MRPLPSAPLALAGLLALAAGCSSSIRHAPASGPSPAATAATDAAMRSLWIDQRVHELESRGVERLAALQQARREYVPDSTANAAWVAERRRLERQRAQDQFVSDLSKLGRAP